MGWLYADCKRFLQPCVCEIMRGNTKQCAQVDHARTDHIKYQSLALSVEVRRCLFRQFPSDHPPQRISHLSCELLLHQVQWIGLYGGTLAPKLDGVGVKRVPARCCDQCGGRKSRGVYQQSLDALFCFLTIPLLGKQWENLDAVQRRMLRSRVGWVRVTSELWQTTMGRRQQCLQTLRLDVSFGNNATMARAPRTGRLCGHFGWAWKPCWPLHKLKPRSPGPILNLVDMAFAGWLCWAGSRGPLATEHFFRRVGGRNRNSKASHSLHIR